MPTHVACVGDSITAGVGSSSSAKSYPGQLQTMLGSGVQVGNFGHSGATMLTAGDLPYVNQSEYTAATTFVSNAGANAVVDVIIMLGTNDSKSYNWTASGGGTRVQGFMTDAKALVDHFANLSTHPRVFVALPPAAYTNTYAITDSVIKNEINPALSQVATQTGSPVIDVYAPTSGHSSYFPDGVHPNDTGCTLLAKTMYDGLRAGDGGGAGGSGGGVGGRGGRGGSGAGGRAAGGAGGGAGGSGATGSGGSGGATTGSGGGAASGSGGASPATGGTVGGTGGTVGGTGGAPVGSGGVGSGGSSAGSGGASVGSGGTSSGSGGSSSSSGGVGSGGVHAGSGGTNPGGSVSGSGGVAGMATSSGDAGCGACDLGRGDASNVAGPALLLLILGSCRRRRHASDRRGRSERAQPPAHDGASSG